MTMRYFSMFSGIGGFELGIKMATNDTFECVGYSEVDKYAESIYKRNFPNHKGFGDATKIRTEDLPDFELLVGGFPCQAFSIAGKRGGFDDTRGTLFFEIARILRDKRPRYFLLENVKGLLSHDKGKTFKTILEVLSDCGYFCRWEVHNSKNYGVPQNRERIFIEGYLRTSCGGEVLSQRRESEEVTTRLICPYNYNRSVNVTHPDGLCGTLTSTGQKSGYNTLVKLNKKPQAQTIYDPDGIACCLSANGGGDGGKTGLYKVDKCWGSTAPHASVTDGTYTPTLCANNIGTPTPLIGEKKIEKVGNLSPSGHHGKNVYDPNGISPTLCANDLYKNGVSIIDKCKSEEISRPVVKRKYDADINELKLLLRQSKENSNLSIKQISEELGLSNTTVEHWFRNDDSFSIPLSAYWFDLKKLINITDDSFDDFITKFEIVEGQYDMSKRAYDSDYLAPTVKTNGSDLIIDKEAKLNPINRKSAPHQHDLIYDENGISPTLAACDYKDPVKVYSDKETIKVKTATKKGYDEITVGDGIRLDHPGSKTGRGRTQEGGTGALTTNSNWGTYDKNYRVRRLTPRECERLQAFPDDWTLYGAEGEVISNTQRYKCCGNAVTVTVVAAIIYDMFEDIILENIEIES